MAGTSVFTRLSGLTRAAAVFAVLAVVASAVVALYPRQDKRYLTADFPRAVSLYTGADVRILGVSVGKVESVRPEGTVVRVRMWYDPRYHVPADAKAAIVSPAIVGDRYVALTPVYRGGPVLPDHAHLGVARTATPLELDQVYRSLDDLSVALGPNGANRQGSLSRLLDVTAANFGGEGEKFNRTVHDLSLLTGTLSHNKHALFSSLRQVERFVHTLAVHDTSVRQFNRQLAAMSTALAGQRDDLARALHNLGVALGSVHRFLHDNRTLLSRNIRGLARLSQVLVHQRDALAESLEKAPLALNNLSLAFNAQAGALNQRTNLSENLNELQNDPALVLCSILNQAGDPARACALVRRILRNAPPSPLPPVPGVPRAAPFGSDGSGHRVVVERIDTTLAGLVGGRR